ncbi:uncharacterized protein LOC144153775 isoform X2 [Haemaphysalis longicornis]
MPLQVKEPAGLHGTKGDEVIHSLAKLLDKVHRLEAKKRAAQECANSELGEHIALVEAQCSLLEDQLRYARRVLAFSTNLRSTPEVYPDVATSALNAYSNDDVFLDDKSRAPRSTTPKVPEPPVPAKQPHKARRSKSTSAVRHTNPPPSRLDQCRLTVADVPFILSKSTSASHSLPANLQNLVSLLNKAKPQCSTKQQDSAEDRHRDVCVVGARGLPRSGSDTELRAASQPDAASRDLVHLLFQGEQLLKQLNQAQVPGTRHSLKCQCRRLISRIQAKMAENASSGNADSKSAQKKKKSSATKRRAASTSSQGAGPFNRIFMRELRRIQDRLEEQV